MLSLNTRFPSFNKVLAIPCIQLDSIPWSLIQKQAIRLQSQEASKVAHTALLSGEKRKAEVAPVLDIYSWNAKVISLFQSGQIKDARELFDKMPERDLVSWNSVITGYARNGRINDALQVFDSMPERNVVSWNAMIAGYAQNGKLQEAGDLFDRMPERNNVSWNTMITAYAKSKRMEDARAMFEEMPSRDMVSWNAMIAGYAKNGRLDNARQLFDKMPKRDVVSWNAMVTGYVQNGRLEDARLLFKEIPEKNIISWNTMISGYAHNGRMDYAGDLFVKMPMRNVVSWTLMIVGYTQNGKLDDARALFDTMPRKNVVSWNAMIMGYTQDGKIDEARCLFDEMPERDVVSWNAMITGYSQTGRIDEACQLFDRIPHRDGVSWNAMIAGFAQNERMEDARRLFDEMPERNLVSWNAMIAGCEHNSHCEEALNLFSQMLVAGVKPDHSSFTSALSACAGLASLGEGKQIQQHILKIGIVVDIPLANSLITMYSKCGIIDDARLVFNEMPEHDVISWNAVIAGDAQHGHAEEGLQFFKQMQQSGIKPNDVTFVGVLSACSHAGFVEEGWRCFDSMTRDYGITPRAEHYASMVDLLARSGFLAKAEHFINRMPLKPDAAVWGALLGACRVHGNVDIAQRAADCLFELEPQNSGPYVLLSNIYAAAGRWDDVLKVRKMMKERGVKKQPGCSWIELKNKVYTFVVGDRLHPQMENIYATLERLLAQIKVAGYVANTNFVLHDMEEEQKEHALFYHSEKLAITFGLLNTSPGTPIRIIKNLRVCGDCHSAIRFISKIVGRNITVRDTNRFHHFTDGFCSCGDYW